MTAIAVAVAAEEHGPAAQHKLTARVAIAAVGQVVQLAAARGADHRNVGVVPSAQSDVTGDEPPAVGAPVEPLVAVAVGEVILAVHHGAYLPCLQVDDAQCSAVFQIGNEFAVGTVFGLKRCALGLREAFLAHVGGVGEQFLVGLCQPRLVDLPVAATLGSVGNGAPVGGEADAALLFGRIGNLARRLIVGGRDKHVAMQYEGYLLATRRHADLGGAAGAYLPHHVALVVVGGNADAHLLRLGTLAQRIDLAVVAIAEQSVVAAAQVAHGVLGVACQLHLSLAVYRPAIDVRGAVFLAQIIIGIAVAAPHGVAVLALIVGQTGVLAVAQQPDVAADGRLVVLAKHILSAFDVVIEHVAAAVDAHVGHRQS